MKLEGKKVIYYLDTLESTECSMPTQLLERDFAAINGLYHLQQICGKSVVTVRKILDTKKRIIGVAFIYFEDNKKIKEIYRVKRYSKRIYQKYFEEFKGI